MKSDREKEISIGNNLFIAWSTKPSKKLQASDSHSTPWVAAEGLSHPTELPQKCAS